jgi:hypothetical protein
MRILLALTLTSPKGRGEEAAPLRTNTGIRSDAAQRRGVPPSAMIAQPSSEAAAIARNASV